MTKTTSARVNGVELFYVDQGEGPSVLFVHGSNSDCRIWADHSRIIAARYRVIALTQRYFGLAAWPDEGHKFSISLHATDLAAFISALGLGPVGIVGWSYGGAVCLTMAAQHAELVRRLVLYEPSLATIVSDPVDAQRAIDDRQEMMRAARVAAADGDVDTAVQLFMDGVNDSIGAFQKLPGRVQALMRENARMLPLLFAAPPPHISYKDLGNLVMPVTVCRGENTRLYYRICAEWAARCIPGARLTTIPEARHLWPIQDPTAFSQLVLDVLSERKG